MQVIVHGKHLTVTSALHEYVERKLGRLDTWFEDTCELHVTLSLQGHKQLHVVEATVVGSGVVLRAEEKRSDMYASIDVVADKLERQARKLKDKIKHKLRHSGVLEEAEFFSDDQETNEPKFEVARIKTIPHKPEDIEEAILQMNLLDHNFHLFFNSDSNKTELVYRRSDGTYGLITTA
ncbi:ribosome hibernation-promoting factor, HPF/YfiA family [Paenibacillus hexagrammi]|uniref:Ribosome hibernation promoting factor n=1 Tax=Paenibacillus hexagrammi TaxID=2908839 RepID=A0ABY3SL13_9BACL|nr:ribosome-associated translation inhibitor RaiA [Paenibacillus sp. YPD9-1]UJF33820.1 ribosome-associated translation inhibitor RaiA [Paenibacillus sp. YPD9-1]